MDRYNANTKQRFLGWYLVWVKRNIYTDMLLIYNLHPTKKYKTQVVVHVMLVELQCAIFLGIAPTLAAWIIVSNVDVSCPGTFSLDHRSEASLPPAAGQMYSHKERAHKLQIKQNAINRAYIYTYIII